MIEAVIVWALLAFMLTVCCAVIVDTISEAKYGIVIGLVISLAIAFALVLDAKIGEGEKREREETGTAVVFEEDGVYIVTVHENSLTVRKNAETDNQNEDEEE